MLVDDRINRAVDTFAVVYRDAVITVDGDAQIPLAALFDVFDVPELVAEVGHHGQKKVMHRLRDVFRITHLQ